MLRLLTLFGGFTVGWWSLLWLVLPLSWQRISPSAMLLLHIVPPVALTLGLRWWMARKEKKGRSRTPAGRRSRCRSTCGNTCRSPPCALRDTG